MRTFTAAWFIVSWVFVLTVAFFVTSSELEQCAPSATQGFCSLKYSDLAVLLSALLAVGVAGLQIIYLHDTLAATARNAQAASDSAEIAFRTAMPVLTPYVTNMSGLHPLKKVLARDGDGPWRTPFTSEVHFTFDNIGKSPAIVREVRAELFLLPRDQLPAQIDFTTMQTHQYATIIPGGSIKASGVVSVIDHKKEFDIPPEEFDELLSNAKGAFRRMALIGRVTYDDFFGERHTRLFCVKMRLFESRGPVGEPTVHAFQSHFGGTAYSRVTREKIPSPDPLEAMNG